MPEHNPGKMGGTMRLGSRRTEFVGGYDSLLKRLYDSEEWVDERHRHRYEVNPQFIEEFEEQGMMFVGRDSEGQRMEILELKGLIRLRFTAQQSS